jgi:MATE family multidrug resistance protein
VGIASPVYLNAFTDRSAGAGWGHELGLVLRIAAPLMVAYLAEYALFLITRIAVGELGYESLAAVGIAGDLTFELIVVAMGFLSVVGVILAQALGANDKRAVGHGARQGLIVGFAVAVPGTMYVLALPQLLGLIGQEPIVVERATPYLYAVAGSVLPTLWFAVLRSFVTALGSTSCVMVISFGAVGLQYVLTMGLVHGQFGLPAMGVAGAGWSMTIVTWVMLIAMVFHLWRTEVYRGFGLFRARLRVDMTACREIVRLGIPTGVLVLFESGLFAAVSILSGVIGAQALAAHQIALGWVGVPFVIALGLAEGTMIRVAHGVGMGTPVAMRQAGYCGIATAVALALLLVVVPVFLTAPLINVFLDTSQPGSSEVVVLAGQLLIIVAIFQVFDALQAVAARALRGMRDTVAPLWIAGFGYWIVGIGGGSTLAFVFDWGAPGLWWGLAAGLIVTGVMLCWRFNELSSPPGSRAREV